MKKELQNKLFESYPKIFRQKDLDKTVSAMCYGIGCGDGWYSLIDTMCGNIKNQMDNVNRNKPGDKHLICEATQVKEKFGGLRFYVQGSDDFIDGIIDLAESMSYRICSQCGNASTPNEKKRGWIYTLCNNCKVT
jgi:hypothetical protein|tara:strand:+ start:2041 stop:2445 length:405 start_codon:yes stop_codon:yes gene_type:complete